MRFSVYIYIYAKHKLFTPTAGTISGEEVPIVSKTNIKEYRDSFSCEKFTFRSNPNITFYVYVSNFSWPIKIQVRVILFRFMPLVFFMCQMSHLEHGERARTAVFMMQCDFTCTLF